MPDKILVTGVAGFIGSHLCEKLLQEGYEVIGVDSLTDYYDIRIKKENLRQIIGKDRFTFHERSLNDIDPENILKDVSFVFHQAAQAGDDEADQRFLGVLHRSGDVHHRCPGGQRRAGYLLPA